MDKINIRNIYIDLLNKIKKVEGVDKDYVDNLIEVVDLHLTALDQDLSAINNVIPEDASVTNQLVSESDLEPITLDIQTLSSTVSGIGIDVSGINAVIPSSATSSNKLATHDDLSAQHQLTFEILTSSWMLGSDSKYHAMLEGTNYFDMSYTPTIFIDPIENDQVKSDFRKLVSCDVQSAHIELVANTLPTYTWNVIVQGKLA